MKKVLLLITVLMMTVSMSAQNLTASKTTDNFYIGINGGVATKTTGHAWLKGLNPNAGLRIGRWFTPVFGFAIDGNAYFSNKPYCSTKTAVRYLNTSLLGTINFSNWFGGYKGEPYAFEIVGIAGLGWGHLFGHSPVFENHFYSTDHLFMGRISPKQITGRDNLTSKVGLDLVFNLGEQKAWQFFVEPAMIWGLNDYTYCMDVPFAIMGNSKIQYNLNRSYFQLNAGFIYKFRNSNGTHNFTLVDDNQGEIDRLNARINQLQDELAKKPKEVEVVKEVIKEIPGVNTVREIRVEDLVFVTFAQGKSELTFDAKTVLNNVKVGRHVQIVGTASPEGNPELNQRLSQARADAVAAYLKERGVIVDEATGKGVQGTTSNRLAVVYVK
jgi:outer membrane protein OmpA-like peptidoglycan-associated protein